MERLRERVKGWEEKSKQANHDCASWIFLGGQADERRRLMWKDPS